jgi:pSer/pThr/pTyr-binding forkhead associated (FHA) protein
VGAAGPAKTELIRKEPEQMAWLVQRSGPRTGKEFRLGEVTNIGRDASQCDIVVDNSTVSRQHARVRLEDGRFVLYDLASSNGTFVNDERVQKQPLLDGDKVRFGDVDFSFMEVRETKE